MNKIRHVHVSNLPVPCISGFIGQLFGINEQCYSPFWCCPMRDEYDSCQWLWNTPSRDNIYCCSSCNSFPKIAIKVERPIIYKNSGHNSVGCPNDECFTLVNDETNLYHSSIDDQSVCE